VLATSGRQVAIATAALSLSVFVALASMIRAGFAGLDVFDPGLAEMRAGPAGPLLDALDAAGSLPVWATLVGPITIILGRRRWRVMGEALSVVILAEVAASAVKLVVARARPPGAEIGDLIIAAGFPSGHVMRTAVLVGVVLFLVTDAPRRRAILALGLAAVVAMGVARVSASAHYTSDVLGGLLLSALILAGWHLISPRTFEVGNPSKPEGSLGESGTTAS
jgi:membrane-associated phospholipid phosphatase